MVVKRIIFILQLLMAATAMSAQTIQTDEKGVASDSLAHDAFILPLAGEGWGEASDEECQMAEELMDVVDELAANPFNLNTATREDLEQLPFLTDVQIEELCEYLYRHGRVQTTGELAMIASLDPATRRLLLRCTYLGGQQKERLRMGELLKHGHSELAAAGHIPLYERHGDQKGYLGYRYKHWMRYTFKAGQHVQSAHRMRASRSLPDATSGASTTILSILPWQNWET